MNSIHTQKLYADVARFAKTLQSVADILHETENRHFIAKHINIDPVLVERIKAGNDAAQILRCCVEEVTSANNALALMRNYRIRRWFWSGAGWLFAGVVLGFLIGVVAS